MSGMDVKIGHLEEGLESVKEIVSDELKESVLAHELVKKDCKEYTDSQITLLGLRLDAQYSQFKWVVVGASGAMTLILTIISIALKFYNF
jgi:hypothetical protein